MARLLGTRPIQLRPAVLLEVIASAVLCEGDVLLLVGRDARLAAFIR